MKKEATEAEASEEAELLKPMRTRADAADKRKKKKHQSL